MPPGLPPRRRWFVLVTSVFQPASRSEARTRMTSNTCPPNALLGLRHGLVHHRLPANRPVRGPLRNRYPRHPAPRGQAPGPLRAGVSPARSSLAKSLDLRGIFGAITSQQDFTKTHAEIVQRSRQSNNRLIESLNI